MCLSAAVKERHRTGVALLDPDAGVCRVDSNSSDVGEEVHDERYGRQLRSTGVRVNGNN